METITLVISVLSLYVAVMALKIEQREKLKLQLRKTCLLLDQEIGFSFNQRTIWRSSVIQIINKMHLVCVILMQILLVMVMILAIVFGPSLGHEPFIILIFCAIMCCLIYILHKLR